MKKILVVIVVIQMIFSMISLCEESISFLDDSGERILLKVKPRRTAVLFSSFAEMWALSGGEISITVGETVERGFCGKNAILVDEGAGKRIDLEALIMSNPDFIIGSYDILAHREARESLRKMGVPFALFKVESIEDYLRVFEHMTTINQNQEAYQRYAEAVYTDALDVIEKAKRYAKASPKQILFIRSGSGYSSAKAKTKDMHFAAKMLEELGGINIAEDIPVIIDGLSFEEIYMKDPDIIFISLMGNEKAAREYMTSLLSGKKWQALKAVKTCKCYFLEKDLFQFKPNHRWSIAYEEMAKMLYPDWMEDE